MKDLVPLAERLAPDTVARLERAARKRFETAELLRSQSGRGLAALYFYGYCVEICLSAAYFRNAGFKANDPIDRDTRQRRMAQARIARDKRGEKLMTGDPHPLVGWARFLEWQRSASGGLSEQDSKRLREAVNRTRVVYNYWRPELRYKVLEITANQLDDVRRATMWILENRAHF